MKKQVAWLLICVTVLGMTACRMPPVEPNTSASTSPDELSVSQSDQQAEEKDEQHLQVVLYIGQEGDFTEYPAFYQGDLDPSGMIPAQEVVGAIATITGWNLDLAREITVNKDGITVCFADTSALFCGPPELQKEQFHVSDSYQLDRSILDSIKKTLQCWAADSEQSNPDGVDVWFCGPDGGDLALPDVGVTISSTQPYQTFPVPEEIQQRAS